MSYEGCLDVRVSLFGTIVTQKKGCISFFEPSGGGRGGVVWFMLSKSPATLGESENNFHMLIF